MTLTYDPVGLFSSRSQAMPAYVTAVSNDTTATVTGKLIDNRDGLLEHLSFQVSASNKTGTSPTLRLVLEGSTNGSSWYSLPNAAGTVIATSTFSISTASAANVIVRQVNTSVTAQGGFTNFPTFVRGKLVVGGSASPGWTGTIAATAIRRKTLVI